MNRKHNFSAGPCVLPISVLEELQAKMVDFAGSGMSLIEMSHRSKGYDEIHSATLASLKELMKVPDDFSILLLQGGASLQFAMAPMNLLSMSQSADYVVAGSWAKKAYADAAKCGKASIAWSGETDNYTRMPTQDELNLSGNARYLHVTSNETISGIRMPDFPSVDVPLVADMSSDYLTRHIPWEKFDVVYGGAQKNIGPAGLTVVFVHNTVLDSTPKNVPSYLSYAAHAKAGSLANTPPVFAIWATGLMLNWITEQGGIEAMQKQTEARSGQVYEIISNSGGFYQSPVAVEDRSYTNVVFTLANSDLEADFLAGAESEGMTNLKGHRSVGGMRASIYNALPDESVKALTTYMESFATARG